MNNGTKWKINRHSDIRLYSSLFSFLYGKVVLMHSKCKTIVILLPLPDSRIIKDKSHVWMNVMVERFPLRPAQHTTRQRSALDLVSANVISSFRGIQGGQLWLVFAVQCYYTPVVVTWPAHTMCCSVHWPSQSPTPITSRHNYTHQMNIWPATHCHCRDDEQHNNINNDDGSDWASERDIAAMV